MRNFNEIFTKDVPYDNFKSRKKPGLQLLFRRYNFRKTTGGGAGQIDPHPSAVLGLKCISFITFIWSYSPRFYVYKAFFVWSLCFIITKFDDFFLSHGRLVFHFLQVWFLTMVIVTLYFLSLTVFYVYVYLRVAGSMCVNMFVWCLCVFIHAQDKDLYCLKW